MSDTPRRYGWARPALSREARGYGWAHRQLRKQVLAEEPLCRLCGAPSTQADHIVPLCLNGPTIRSNYQALCDPCGRKKSSQEGLMMRRLKHLDRTNGPKRKEKNNG